MSKPLQFHELNVGEHFIAFPQDGDDSGHGGYRGRSWLMRKTRECPEGSAWDGKSNYVRIVDGVESAATSSMLVLRVGM